MPAPESCPAAIRTDESNPFARFSMVTRVPKILDDLIDKNRALAPRHVDAIHRLRDEIIAGAPLRELETGAPDVDDWSEQIRLRAGQGWLTTDWFFAETLVYRRVIDACRWWETGDDPFVEHKREELASAGVWERLEASLESYAADVTERISAQLLSCLWGNRVDLSYPAAVAHGHAWGESDLLSDHRAWALSRVQPISGRYDLIADNAGTELLADLVLVDTLLEAGASVVTMHVKLHPTFVSDATAEDVRGTLRAMQSTTDLTSRTGRAGRRLQAAFDAGSLRLAPDLFWNGPRFAWDMPPRVRRALAASRLAIVKGDANYRRVIGDAIWPPDAPFTGVAQAWPCPVVTLRTLKSDAVLGLPTGMAEALDTESPGWRVSGKRGVIQGGSSLST